MRNFLLLFSIISLSSCLTKNEKVTLLNKNEQNIILFEKGDSKIFINSRLKERINSISEKNIKANSDLLRLSLLINEFSSLIIKKFSISIWEKQNSSFKSIVDGKIYFDEELLTYNDFYKIQDGVENFSIKSSSDYPLNTIFLIETIDSKNTFLSEEFIVEVDMSFVLNNEEHLIHKRDTLYRHKSSEYQFRAH